MGRLACEIGKEAKQSKLLSFVQTYSLVARNDRTKKQKGNMKEKMRKEGRKEGAKRKNAIS